MSKPWENIILSWQQALIVGGFIVSLGVSYNDLIILKKELEFLKERIDRRVNPLEQELKIMEGKIIELEKCK